jgi:hypothetical protein
MGNITNNAHICQFEHKKGTWYEACTICDQTRFLGLGEFPSLNKVCNSENQHQCIIDTGISGKMNPDECNRCPKFY